MYTIGPYLEIQKNQFELEHQPLAIIAEKEAVKQNLQPKSEIAFDILDEENQKNS